MIGSCLHSKNQIHYQHKTIKKIRIVLIGNGLINKGKTAIFYTDIVLSFLTLLAITFLFTKKKYRVIFSWSFVFFWLNVMELTSVIIYYFSEISVIYGSNTIFLWVPLWERKAGDQNQDYNSEMETPPRHTGLDRLRPFPFVKGSKTVLHYNINAIISWKADKAICLNR